jgi:hypothetical protein
MNRLVDPVVLSPRRRSLFQPQATTVPSVHSALLPGRLLTVLL